jgi:hypothetical protein
MCAPSPPLTTGSSHLAPPGLITKMPQRVPHIRYPRHQHHTTVRLDGFHVGLRAHIALELRRTQYRHHVCLFDDDETAYRPHMAFLRWELGLRGHWAINYHRLVVAIRSVPKRTTKGGYKGAEAEGLHV